MMLVISPSGECCNSAWILFGSPCHFLVESYPLQRHVTEFMTDNRYVKGETNYVADAL